MGKKAKAKDKERRKAAALEVAGPDAPAALSRTLATRLNSVAIHLSRRLSREDAALGLTAARLSALAALDAGGPLTLGTLARTERVTAPSMTRLITAMETDGLVERIPSAADGRMVFVRLTPSGRDVMRRGQERRIEALGGWLHPIGAAGLQCLDTATDLLESVLREEPA